MELWMNTSADFVRSLIVGTNSVSFLDNELASLGNCKGKTLLVQDSDIVSGFFQGYKVLIATDHM
jgi:hypothetical protein